jgi:hypothetical protein
MKDYKTKLKEKQDYGTGATRDNANGKGRFDLVPDIALTRVVKVYERGGLNHGDRNWEKGLPLSRLIDSAIRHIIQYKMSKYTPELRDEDHLAHAIWNLMAVIHNEEMIERGALPKELDNLPRYEKLDQPTEMVEPTEKDESSEEKCEEDAVFADPMFVMRSRIRCMCNREDGEYKCDKYKDRFRSFTEEEEEEE